MAKAIDAAALTKQAVLEMLISDRDLARELSQAGAAIRAAELLGKELGMFIERRATTADVTVHDDSKTELRNDIAGLLSPADAAGSESVVQPSSDTRH